jgi:hypothetical protein
MATNSNVTGGIGKVQVFEAELIEDPGEQERLNRDLPRPDEWNYRVLVRHYKASKQKCLRRELAWFAEHPSLESAIDHATMSVDWKGRRFSHQHRIKTTVLQSAKETLLGVAAELRQCHNFEELFHVIDEALKSVKGVGRLYIYDVSLRIGAKLGGAKDELLPQKVYLHAGTRKGAMALGLKTNVDFLEMESLPEWLRELTAYEIEDFLCIYKSKLSVDESARAS